VRAALWVALGATTFAGAARADDSPNVIVAPTALLQTDFQAHPQDAEGDTGFSIARFRLGAFSNPAPWLLALAQVQIAESDGPLSDAPAGVLDAYVRVGPWHGLRVTVGYSRSPLFVSARNEVDGMQPFPELSLPVQALGPGRDVGVEAHYTPSNLPFEAWLRVGNGNSSPFQSNYDQYALTARVDATWGRGRIDATGSERFGFRIGAAGLVNDTYDRAGIGGTIANGFQFYMPPVVKGMRRIVEVHALGYAGPFRALVEAGGALEDRASTNGSASSPSTDPEVSRGAAVELACMLTGEHRVSSVWPVAPSKHPFAFDHAAFEIAARAERLDVGLGMRDFAPGGGSALSLSANAWLNDLLAVNVAGYYYHYDVAPISEPTRTDSFLLLARVTVYLNPPPLGPIGTTRTPWLGLH
jgi:phosphate-selective porin OprO/OprP